MIMDDPCFPEVKTSCCDDNNNTNSCANLTNPKTNLDGSCSDVAEVNKPCCNLNNSRAKLTNLKRNFVDKIAMKKRSMATDPCFPEVKSTCSISSDCKNRAKDKNKPKPGGKGEKQKPAKSEPCFNPPKSTPKEKKCCTNTCTDDPLMFYFEKYKSQILMLGFLLVVICLAHKLMKCLCSRRR